MPGFERWRINTALTVLALGLAGCDKKDEAEKIDRNVPACTSKDVIGLVDDMIRKSALGPTVQSISGYREVSYDPESQIRKGECEVKTQTETLTAKYTVKWLNRPSRTFQVEVEPIYSTKSITCTSPEVVEMVKDMIQENLKGQGIVQVSQYREIRYDPATQIRTGECRVKTLMVELTVTYQVKPVSEKYFEVMILSGLGPDPLAVQWQPGQPWRPGMPQPGRIPGMPQPGRPGPLGRPPGQVRP